MKIVQVIPSLELAGAERMCENLSLELKKKNHDIYVISLYDKTTEITENLKKNGIKVYMLGKKAGIDLSIIKPLNAILHKIKPNIIHTHLYVVKYVLPYVIFSKVKVVHTVHNEADKEVPIFDQILHKILFKIGKVVPVAISKEIAKTISLKYKIEIPREQIIINGVPIELFMPKKNDMVNGRFTILNLARITEQKNSLFLAKVFNDSFRDKCELWYVGGAEEKYLKRLCDYIEKNDLTNQVKIMGIQQNVKDILNRCDVFVLPSKYEGVPLAIIEAMATGLPIIATMVGGIPDILDDGENALLCQCDEKEISDAINMVMTNSELREKLGTNALKKSKQYSSAVMANKYLDIYENKKI